MVIQKIVKKCLLEVTKLIFLFFITTVQAKLPIEFISVPQINDMALGQSQTLNYVIQNQSSRQTFPIRGIYVKNLGDLQDDATFAISNNCGNALPPLAICSITLNIQNLRPGIVNRVLSIDYNSRAPLNSYIHLGATLAHYTILIYIVGTDLESLDNFATANIEQMMRIGSTKNMNVVIETGGSNKAGWQTVQRKLVLPGKISLLADLGNISMGASSTIQDFLQWGISAFPAEKYIAIFWDHGGGPNGGYGGSESSPPPVDTPINQLAAIMRNIYASTGYKFEIIGFDACFLGNTETFSGLYPYTNYLIGSEDLEPGLGWQYNTFLNFVNQNPNSDGLNIGREIVNGYTLQNRGESTTLSVITSANIPNLLTAIDNFAALLQQRLSTPGQEIEVWKNIAKSRFRAPDYGTSVWDNKSYDVVDLLEFAQAIQYWFSADLPVVAAATSVINAVEDTVSYYQNSPNRQQSFGLTTYYPSILPAYDTDYPTVTKLNGTEFFSTNYVNLVSEYHNFYLNNMADLTAGLSNFSYDAVDDDYTVDVSNDYDEMYAGVGSDTCNYVLDNNGDPVTVPCVSTIQNPDSNGEEGTLTFNKGINSTNWPLLNNIPILLIPNDTNPNLPDEETFLIPVNSQRLGLGYLSVIKNETNQYEVVGFQRSAGSVNTQSKLFVINDGDWMSVRTYANFGGSWSLRSTNLEVVAPLTISFNSLPSDFDTFRFLVGDLTGKLVITATGLPY